MFSFFGFSPEQSAAMEEEHRRTEMMYDEFRHSFLRLFEELSLDQLETLKTMVHIMAVHGDAQPLASNWEGMIAQVLKYRFNICPTCAVNHDDERPTSHADDELVVVQDDTVLPTFGDLTPEQHELMELYHLDDLRDEDTNELLGFICTGIEGMKRPCGVKYVSIEDRMLREPEHCSGCFSRMGQG